MYYMAVSKRNNENGGTHVKLFDTIDEARNHAKSMAEMYHTTLESVTIYAATEVEYFTSKDARNLSATQSNEQEG